MKCEKFTHLFLVPRSCHENITLANVCVELTEYIYKTYTTSLCEVDSRECKQCQDRSVQQKIKANVNT